MIDFILENPHTLSVNSMYFQYPVKGKIRSIKTDALKDLQAYYSKELKKNITNEQIQELKDFIEQDKKNNGVMITLEIGFPMKNMRRSDISNYIKAIEDCIVKRTGIDDKHHLKVVAYKSISTDKDKKMVRIRVEPYSLSEFNTQLEENTDE